MCFGSGQIHVFLDHWITSSILRETKGTSRVSKGRSNLASSAHRGGDQAGSLRRISTRLKRQQNIWRAYRDLCQQIARLDCVAIANFIPWGSQNTLDLVAGLGSANKSLLQRALEFADDLNAEIVQALAPKLLIVPLSLGRNNVLDAACGTGLSLRRVADATPFSVRMPKGTFNFYTAICKRGRGRSHGFRTAPVIVETLE